ncbi:WXG100 family type VII secretion target [Brachybacterium sp. GCM10030267]|uniref:WXG100 family type VII secretion target n=1 Tax=Brachybacterium sp. GCM10030267 TaxID=3273381 RepID=UPI0036168DC5
MAGFYGADTEQLRSQASAFGQGAQRIADLADTATALIDSVEWVGPDATAFREHWHGTVRPRMLASEHDIRGSQRELEQHATEQDQASSGGMLYLPSLPDFGPFPFPYPMPFPMPLPGGPLDPGILRRGLGDAFSDWFTGGGGSGPQGFYGGPGYGVGNAASDGRPVGQYSSGGSHWDGREIDNELGYADGYANTRASAGHSTTVDAYGNTTHTAGARAGAEIGFDEKLNLPGGASYQTDGRVGAEAYGEAGVTYGPDGASAGAAAGAGAYGDIHGTLAGPHGASATVGATGYAGAEAHANAYAHATRNDEGNVNGFTFGADAGAFAGAKADADIARTSPGGWLSSSASFGVEAGAGLGGSVGGTVSTDEVGIAVGGDVAAALGVKADLAVSIHPNEIVNDITPGDYNLDDAIGDAKGAFDGATEVAGDVVGAINPFD